MSAWEETLWGSWLPGRWQDLPDQRGDQITHAFRMEKTKGELFLIIITSAEEVIVFSSAWMSVCPSDNWKGCERILTKFLGGVGHGPGTNEFNFGDDPDHRPDPRVRSPKSEIRIHWIIEKVTTDFDVWTTESWGCGLETNWLHVGNDPHHYPDPGVRSGSRSGSGKNCYSFITLAFGGGLCSLRTSSW